MTFEKTLTFSAKLIVREKISGPLNLSIESSRCTLDMKSCEYFNTLLFKQICKKFDDPNPLYQKMFGKITPAIKCPIAAGNYTLQQTELDFLVYQFLPIDGYYYNSFLKSTSGGKMVWCLKTEITILKKRV